MTKLSAADVARISTAAWETRPEYPGLAWTWWAVRGGGHALLRIWVAHEEPDPRVISLVLLRREKPTGVKLGMGYVGPLVHRGSKLLRPAPLG